MTLKNIAEKADYLQDCVCGGGVTIFCHISRGGGRHFFPAGFMGGGAVVNVFVHHVKM